MDIKAKKFSDTRRDEYIKTDNNDEVLQQKTLNKSTVSEVNINRRSFVSAKVIPSDVFSETEEEEYEETKKK